MALELTELYDSLYLFFRLCSNKTHCVLEKISVFVFGITKKKKRAVITL
jgi:hypothetical protein